MSQVKICTHEFPPGALDSPPPAKRWGGVGGGGYDFSGTAMSHPGAFGADPPHRFAGEGSCGTTFPFIPRSRSIRYTPADAATSVSVSMS